MNRMKKAFLRLSLLGRFSIITLLLMAAIATALALGIQDHLEKNALLQEAEDAASVVARIVKPYMLKADFSGPLGQARYEQIDTIIRQHIISDHIVRVKIWNRDGMVIYSDRRELMGLHFPADEELREALEGKMSMEISDLKKEENSSERGPYGRLMEIYVPIQPADSARIEGAYEIYHKLSVLDPHLSRMRRFVWGSVGLGFLLLYGSLFTLVRRASRELIGGSEENGKLYEEVKQQLAERKKSEEALQQAEEKYRSIFENAVEGIFQATPEGRYLSVNPVFAQMLGYESPEELITTVTDITRQVFVKPELRSEFLRLVEKRGVVSGFEFELYRKDSNPIWVSSSVRGVRDAEGKVLFFEGFVQDITEHKRAEEALRKSEEKLRELFDNAPIGYCEYDAEAKICNINRTQLEMTGYSFEEMIGQPAWKSVVGEEASRKTILGKLAGAMPPSQGLERRIVRKDGTTFPILIRDRVLRNENGKITGMLSTIQDITDLKQAEEALQESKEKFRELYDNAPAGYQEYDTRGRISNVNQTLLEMIGYSYEEMIGQPVWKYSTVEEVSRKTILDKLAGTAPPAQGLERDYRRKDGTTLSVLIRDRVLRDADGRITAIRSTIQDITDRKRAEEEKAALQEQLRQSQKMEAIGQLAGGIAHDFNNLLTVIKGYSQLSLLDLKEGGPLRGNIDEIQKAANRAAELTRQLLAFSRRQILETKVLDLNDLTKGLDKMLRRIIGEDIELVSHLGANLGRVKADPGQMEQVVINLAVNARDAMPVGGKLTIETANVELDEAYAQAHAAVTPGHYVMLSVSDTGMGMTPEVRDRVFEPFFTTKEKGKGTGLGLSTAYGIVKQSGGNIWVYSEPEKGTAFKIYLPRVDELLEEPKRNKAEKTAPHGGETVLVVEDEKEVRKVAVRVLEKQGYRILTASSGEDALSLCKERKEPIHLLLTDVVMPGMSGRALAENLVPFQPKVKVLYMSGYTDNAIVHHGVLDAGTNYIQKPFTMEGLAAKVREVLGK